MIQNIQNADTVSDAEGRKYHINLAPGELAEYIILVGEAARVDRIEPLLTDIRTRQYNREYKTLTGKYNGVEVSIMSTGMGPGCTEIGLIEIFQITKNPSFIRVGTCGALREDTELGDLIISTGAVRLEDTSTYFVHEAYPAIAHHEAIIALIKAANDNNIVHQTGITASASGFYGAQGRKLPGIHTRYPNLPDELAKMNVVNFEMESSTLFNLCALKGFRTSTVCTAVAHRYKNTFINAETKQRGEANAIKVGLDSLVILAEMDKQKARTHKSEWVPEKI